MIICFKKLITFIVFIINYFNLYYKKFVFDNKKPKISIFLPIYNKELYLKNCLDSLQKQTLKNIEIVAVNDGSNDNSLKLLKKYSKLDKRIKIVNNDRNHGLLYSRAMGILNSTGEYLMNLDPDDKLISKNDLSSLYRMAKRKNYDIIIYLIKRIAVKSSEVKYFKYLDDNQLIMTDDHITNKLIKKEIYLKAFNEFESEIFDYHWNYHEDNIWSFLVRKYGNSIGILNKYIYYYKRNEDSLNNKAGNALDLKNRIDRIKMIQKIDYKMSIEQFRYHLNQNFKNYYLLKNNEIKNKIINAFIDLIKFYGNDIEIYKQINFVLHKFSQNKIIIFYNNTDINQFFNCVNITEFNSIINSNKHIISINMDNINDKNDIDDYILENDTLIFFNNTFFLDKLKFFLESHKNNRIFAFFCDEDNLNELKLYESLKIYISNDCRYIT